MDGDAPFPGPIGPIDPFHPADEGFVGLIEFMRGLRRAGADDGEVEMALRAMLRANGPQGTAAQ